MSVLLPQPFGPANTAGVGVGDRGLVRELPPIPAAFGVWRTYQTIASAMRQAELGILEERLATHADGELVHEYVI